MTRVINPYQSVPFYLYPNLEGKECPLNSPTRQLPCFQIEINSPITTADCYIEKIDGSYSAAIPGLEIANFTNSTGYLTYDGSLLTQRLDEGYYRIRAVIGSNTYYSHVICASRYFDTLTFDLDPVCNIDLLTGFVSFQVFFDVDPLLPSEAFVSFNDGFTWARLGNGISGDAQGTFQSPAMNNGTARVRLQVWRDDAPFYKEYLLSFDVNEIIDPCSTVQHTLLHTANNGLRRFISIEWVNVNDLQNLGLMYNSVQSQTYRHQYYTEAYIDIPATVQEEQFLENGVGARTLDFVRFARQHNIDFYGVPDPLIAPLTSIRYHDVQIVREVVDDTQTVGAAAEATFTKIEGAICSQGRLSMEFNRELVGCQDNLQTS